MAMTQAESYADFWVAHRDRAGPLSPADVWGLREDREFVAPSKAHVKRLTRVRPVVTRADAKVPDVSARQSLAQRVRAGRQVLEACGCLPPPYAPIPSDYVRPATIVPGAPRIAADHAERRRAQIEAECARIAVYGSDELSRAWRLWLTR